MSSSIVPFPAPPAFDLIGLVDRPIPVLNPKVEFMRFCYACQSDQLFTADRICASGLIGKCACGDERIVLFTRVTSEVA